MTSLNKEVIQNNKSLKDRFKTWAFKNSLNPIILGDKNFSTRLQSFFVTSPLLVHFDHNSMFDDYSEKNLLILIGPLSDIQKEKVSVICKQFRHQYQVVYLEMTFENIKNKEAYIDKLTKEIGGIEIDKFLIEDFISLDSVSNLLREIA